MKTFNQAVLAAIDTHIDKLCFQTDQGGVYDMVSYREFQTLAFRLARFFTNQGLTPGDRVALVAPNSHVWMASYVACLMCEGVAVPLDLSLAPLTLHRILKESGASLALLDDQTHLDHLLSVWSPANPRDLSKLNTVLIISEEFVTLPDVTSLDAVLAEPLPTPEEEATFRINAESIAPHARAAIHYVIDNDGQSKGAVFTQAQLEAGVRHLAEWLIFEDDELAFTIGPWSSLSSLIVGHHYFRSGIPNALCNNFEGITHDMRQTSPTIMFAVPYALQLFYDAYMERVAKQPTATQDVFRWALAKGRKYATAGDTASPELTEAYQRAYLTFFSELRGEVGGRLRRIYAVGAISPDVSELFEAMGVPVYGLYSFAEAGGFPTFANSDTYRSGSVGRVAPGYEIKIAEDSEILINGEAVVKEYWQRLEETQQLHEHGGWLHTEDLGYFDDEGYLFITERKHHMIVMSTGRKIAAVPIEQALSASPFITQAAVVGEGKSYLSAMIVPDLAALAEHFSDVATSDDTLITTTHPQVKALLEQVIGEVNRGLDRWEQVQEFRLLEQPLSQDAGELTPSMKISRHTVAQRYASQIEAMYPVTPKLKAQEVSQVEVEPERLRELLEKEKILDAWMADAGIEFLFELARAKEIDAPAMVNICDTVAMIAQMENEEVPLSTALIVGDPVRVRRVLPPSQIQLRNQNHIRRMRRMLVTMAKVVDGLVLGYLVDKYGYVRGIRKLEMPLSDSDNYLLGPQFRRHATISQQADAVVFFVPTGGRQVRVFAEGQLVGRYANGDWSPDSMTHVQEVIRTIATEKEYDAPLIRRILRCAFEMSEGNMGAIFIIGHAQSILERSDTSEMSHFATITSVSLDHLTDQELINFARQDGATIIDVAGFFAGCMILLRPHPETSAEIGPGKGARHSSAAKMSAEADCLAITVSHDGPITIYDSGQRRLSL